jgi:hypothetical protein
VWANANLTTKALQDFRKSHRQNDLMRWLMFYNNTLVLPFSDDTKSCRDCNPHVRVMLAGVLLLPMTHGTQPAVIAAVRRIV